MYKKGRAMGFDFGQLGHMGGQIDQVLSTLPYPLDKDEICQHARKAGANDQVVGAMERILPDKMFKSPQEIKDCLGGNKGQTQV
jgi:uncharacterized protein DUF2795